MCVSVTVATVVNEDMNTAAAAKCRSISISELSGDAHPPILPGLPDDVAKHCLGLVPRSHFPAMAAVCKEWRSFMSSGEFIAVRRLAGALEEWLYFLTADGEGCEPKWVVVDRTGRRKHELPLMPGPVKSVSGTVVVDGKLMVIGGYSIDDDGASSDLYQYDSFLNSWTKLASTNVARYDFACAEVNGLVYAVGGCGTNGESLSFAEVYDPEAGKWTLIESPRLPRRSSFACTFGDGKLYVMGGRSDFTIGNSRHVDVYDPEGREWSQTKNGCVMVTAHAVLNGKLFFVEWKNERDLAVFDPVKGSREKVRIPMAGSSRVGFRFGTLEGKLLLFSGSGTTLTYDPEAPPGSEWGTNDVKPPGSCMRCVTIKA